MGGRERAPPRGHDDLEWRSMRGWEWHLIRRAAPAKAFCQLRTLVRKRYHSVSTCRAARRYIIVVRSTTLRRETRRNSVKCGARTPHFLCKSQFFPFFRICISFLLFSSLSLSLSRARVLSREIFGCSRSMEFVRRVFAAE